jgi:hypothetical protein
MYIIMIQFNEYHQWSNCHHTRPNGATTPLHDVARLHGCINLYCATEIFWYQHPISAPTVT